MWVAGCLEAAEGGAAGGVEGVFVVGEGEVRCGWDDRDSGGGVGGL